jgi:NADPH:quinone reductase-like Zn-dependent oxidoreductase
VRWGDAELTLAQVKRRLRIEKWLLLLTATGGIGFFAVMLAAMAYVG